MKKEEKAITLIALIITIIVMLILVAVTVNVVLNGGLFNQAQKAKYQTEVSIIKDYVTEKTATLLAENQNDDALKDLTNLGQLNIDQELKDKYEDKLEIHDGILYYKPEVVTNEEERQWLEQIDVYPYSGQDEPVNPENPQKAELKVGDYIDYPASGVLVSYVNRAESGISYGGESNEKGQGYNPDISTNNSGWRVLDIDENTGKITLVSATASTPNNTVHGELVLKREQVYNNGVELLNRVCDELYTVDGVGKARSMNLEDIYNAVGEELPVLTYSTIKASFSAEGSTHVNTYYPAKLADEAEIEIDGEINENGLSHSESGAIYLNDKTIYTLSQGDTTTNTGLDKDKTYKQFTSTLKLGFTDTWVTNINTSISNLNNETLKEVILGKDETRTWWIATRSISSGSWWGNYTANFGMLQMKNGAKVSSEYNYGSQSDSGNNACDYLYGSSTGQLAGWLRPVIELDTSKTIDTTITDTTDGSFEHPWRIVDK